ncbi:MAG: AraC family transcriptional regulator ligand-binding domain-containing protein [Azonexus sp.]|nr:AraC family transcriptional regulator ligand-binding domain-containing protein [Azonexus sp.]
MRQRSIHQSTPTTQTTVAMGFVTGMLAGLARRQIDPAPLLAATVINLADTANRVPIERYAALYNRINRELDDEGFGLFAQPMRLGSFEFLCRGCLSAATLDEALQRASRFLRIVLPDLAVTVRRSQSRAELLITERRPLGNARPPLYGSAGRIPFEKTENRSGDGSITLTHPDLAFVPGNTVPVGHNGGGVNDPGRIFAFEWLLRLLHGLSCWLAGRGLALDSVIFPYQRPEHADDYALIFTEDSRFAPTLASGVGTLVASFNANLLDLPIRRDEAALTAFLNGAPGKITTLYRRDREMVIRVRDLLRAALPATLSLDDIAGRLHLSPRTIHRRLEDEGASFRSIKDALRRDMALSRLTKTRDSIADVAADLGYADTSAFYRAFVEWTGMAPVHYRRKWLGEAA